MVLTPRQKEVYDFLCRYIEAQRYAPTIAEIQAHFGLSSPASVHQLLTALEHEGLITRVKHASRGIEIVREKQAAAEQAPDIPLLGLVAAGRPIEAILNNETLSIPEDMLGRGRTFALRVRGDSMIDEHIADGDFIIVESRQTAANGEMVVALVDGAEATVKRFYLEGDQVRLEPANPSYQPIIVRPANRVSIQGVVVGVIRKYLR
ncbi:MAG TPA: transcriptional repressor LexA [Blastocatellia bacterium]|nr:transcriptional repressor LexA [Blastocatellia bacterium]